MFGQSAVELSNACYVDGGSIFYDMKRWISDYGKEEEITDREGRRTFLARKEIIRAYFGHIIRVTENHFKCRVKQKFLFGKLFVEILPDYILQTEEMLDEGVSVLYNTISGMLDGGKAGILPAETPGRYFTGVGYGYLPVCGRTL